uniref:Wunen n=1 Tax=Papilio xuthus TaxID=66420 RepID=I4DPH3_PAPXU|nr:wunen [Papilio xuthus]
MAVDRLIWKIALDFFVLLCVAFPLLGLLLWAEPYHRGYFADDYSLRLPYKQQQQLTVNAAKYVIGRLRPHFFDLCRPIPNSSSPLNELGYIQAYTCSGASAAQLKEMRLSFPSAHASFAMYTAVFFIFYIQVKGKWRGSKLLRHGCQFAALIAAWYVGLSRVVDHMHHWSDVTVGFIVGFAFGAIIFVYVLKPKKYGMPRSWETGPPEMLPQPVMSR